MLNYEYCKVLAEMLMWVRQMLVLQGPSTDVDAGVPGTSDV